jgi:hypothetical protein
VSTAPSTPTSKTLGQHCVKIILSLIAVCLAGLIAVLTVSLWPAPPLQWVTEPLAIQSAPPGKFAQLKAKVLNFASPLWRPFRRNRRVIQVGVTVRRLYADVPPFGGLGPPISTNLNGSRAWVFNDARQHRYLEPDAISGSSPSLSIPDGCRMAIRMMNTSVVSGTNDTSNLLIDICPKLVGNSVRLDVAVASTDGPMSPPKTNFFSCRAQLPKTGSLTVECPRALCADGRHYWFEFYPIVIDSTPNKPKR